MNSLPQTQVGQDQECSGTGYGISEGSVSHINGVWPNYKNIYSLLVEILHNLHWKRSAYVKGCPYKYPNHVVTP